MYYITINYKLQYNFSEKRKKRRVAAAKLRSVGQGLPFAV